MAKRPPGWVNRLITWARRKVLIKAVAQAILSYSMTVLKLPSNLCQSIESIVNRFWWGNDIEKRKIHCVGKERLCDRKEVSGLGFRDLETFNNAMLSKQLWCLIYEPNCLAAHVLEAKYYPDCDIMDSALGSRSSFIWRSI